MAYIEKRISDKGKATYRVQVRLRGFPPQTATFDRITDAKTWASKTETEIKEGRYFKTNASKKHTLGEMIDRYKRDVLPNKSRSGKFSNNQGSQLDWWKAELGYHALADITPALLAERRDKLANTKTSTGKKRSPSTVVRYMAALSHAFTIAVKEWGWLDDSPMRKVSKPREPRGRVRFLSDKERKALLKACIESSSEYLYPIVVLALSTGMRQGEMLNLRWNDINLKEQYIILHETKNGERRRVPLTGHALEEISKLSENKVLGANLVFPGERKSNLPFTIDTLWKKAVESAKLEDFRFHDLRHSAASYLAMNGASLAEIAEVLGHKTLQMVKRYAHLSEAHTSKVVAATHMSPGSMQDFITPA